MSVRRNSRIPRLVASRKRLWGVGCIAFLVGIAFIAWDSMPLPASGGGKPDGLRTRWAKSQAYAEIDPLDEQGYVRLTLENAHHWFFMARDPVQSVEAYQNQNPHRPKAARRTIVLQPIGPLARSDKVLVDNLSEYCRAFFQLPVRVQKPLSLQLAARWTRPQYSGIRGRQVGRGQYDADALIDHVLVPRVPPDAAVYLGLTMADLYATQLNWVLGIGRFDSRAGIHSLCRYGPEFWNRKPRPGDDVLRLRRACQVTNHEIGHMFGVSHCVFYKCSMNGSDSLFENDNTPLDYCPICGRKLAWDLGYDGVKRYKDLLTFYQRHGLVADAHWTQRRLARWKQLQVRG